MTEATIKAIETLAKADPESNGNAEQIRAILAVCRRPNAKRKLIMAKEAMEILSCSRPTLRRMTRAGILHEVKPTPRKTRFFLDEVENALYNGAEA